MRNWILQLLVLSQLLGPSFGYAERARKRPPKATQKLLKWVNKDWVDITFGKDGEGGAITQKKAKDISELLNEINKAKGSDKNQNKSGGGSGSGKLVFDDNASKNGSGEQPKENVGDRGGKPPGGGDNRPPGDKPIVFELYWAMCIFFDPSVSDAQANEIVKGSIDKAGACGVNLNVVPITINSNYPKSDPDAFNKQQQASCNMQSIGVPVASTLLANPDPTAAARMCDVKISENPLIWDTNVAGCAQLRSGGGINPADMASMKGSMGGGGMADGGIIPSVIVPNGWNSGVASHEAIGHSQMGWPNYDDPSQQDNAGLGIGSPKKKRGAANEFKDTDVFSAMLEDDPNPRPIYAAGAEGSGFDNEGWDQSVGCPQMRKMALPNTFRFGWSPKQTVYTMVEKDPSRQWQLGNPLWGPVPPGGPPSAPPPIVNNERPQPPEQDKTKLVMNDEGPKISAAPPPEDDGRHRKRKKSASDNGGQEIDRLLTNLRKKGGEAPDDKMTREKPPEMKGDGRNGSNLVFDDSAKKGGDAPSGDASTSISSGTDVGGGMSGDSAGSDSGSLTFDESAAKGGAADSSRSSRNSSGGDSGSTSGGGANRKPASLTGDFFEKNLSKNAVKGKESSMDDGFFDSIIKAETKKRKRVKGETLRAKMREKAQNARTRPSK